MEQHVKEFESLVELLEDLDREGITGLDRARNVENFLMRKSRLHGKPYCASFELTPLCNFDCKMCYMHLTKEQMQHEGRLLTTEEWLDIAQQTVGMGVRHIDLTGGECLSYSGFEKIYTYLINQGMHVSVLTNGQLITDRHIELFKRFKPSVVQISLYGSNPEAYVKVTGRDGFQDVMNAVNRLRTAGIHVCMSVTPHRYMQEDVAAMLDLLHDLRVDYTIGSSILPARPETGRDIADYVVDTDAYIEICKLESRYREALAAQYSLTQPKSYKFALKGQDSLDGPPCTAGTANFHINWKGEMMPCAAFHSVRYSVLTEGLERAWYAVRDTMKSYQIPQECRECNLQKVCVGCAAEKGGGQLNGPVNPYVCSRMRASMTASTALTTELSQCT